jgi:hypothetical protein
MRFGGAVAADNLASGRTVVVDGQITEVSPDPADPGRIRIVLTRTLAGLEDGPDERAVILSVPADMKLATAQPFDEDDDPL